MYLNSVSWNQKFCQVKVDIQFSVWEHLSSLYTNSPFLNLDNEKEEKFVNDVNSEAIEQYEETSINNDILNNSNDDIVDGKIELDNQIDEENISKD